MPKKDPSKICFIVCYNDEQYVQECNRYILALQVPDGMEITTLFLTEADSMTSAYNYGMQNSDAKYKVYLHQDTFIIHKEFIAEILKIFSDPSIGMIGMVGSLHLPDNGMMWYGPRVGGLYANVIYQTMESNFAPDCPAISDVEAIDGFMMITQYDLAWREDLIKNWHFYDISQSMEFRQHGYRIVVPAMPVPWCIHDQQITSLNHYYEEREKFICEYAGYFQKHHIQN